MTKSIHTKEMMRKRPTQAGVLLFVIVSLLSVSCSHSPDRRIAGTPHKANGGLNGDLLYHPDCRIKTISFQHFKDKGLIKDKQGQAMLQRTLERNGYEPQFKDWKTMYKELDSSERFIWASVRKGCEIEVHLDAVTGVASTLDVYDVDRPGWDNGNPITPEVKINYSPELYEKDRRRAIAEVEDHPDYIDGQETKAQRACRRAFRKAISKLPLCRTYDSPEYINRNRQN